VAAVLLLALALAGCAAGSFLSYKVKPNYPRNQDDTIRLPGLEEPATVFLDEYGIPHIEAANELDLLRVTGYVQARERFFAMDAMRRLACGRLSELVGEQPLVGSTTVEYDRAMRGWGFEALAAEDARALDPANAKLLEAYVDGINAALARHKPVEYRLLDVTPKPWTLEDTFALGRLNAWTVTHNWQQELSRLLLAMEGGVERSMRIHPQEPWKGLTSLPAVGEARELLPAVVPEVRALLAEKQPLPDGLPCVALAKQGHGSWWHTEVPFGAGKPLPDGHGPWWGRRKAEGSGDHRGLAASMAGLVGNASNAWVVGGDRSVSGKPMMANDPHLTHLLPSLLFQQSLRAPGIQIIGVTMAGLPYVLAGHNGKVAWGMTSSVADAQDLVIELPEGDDHVRTPDGKSPIETVEHVILVREGKGYREIRVTMRHTPNGPLANDIHPDVLPPGSPLVAIRTAPSCGASSLVALRKAAQASNVHELRAALIRMESPSQVWQAADIEGNIALFANGTLPIRRGYRGTFPVPGWLPDYGWDGLVKQEDLPFAVSKTGFFSNANNLLLDPHFGTVFVGVDSSPSYRHERIMNMLESREKHSAADLQHMQMDVVLERGRRIAPIMVAALTRPDVQALLTSVEQSAVQLLKDWDYNATPDSAATAVFFSVYRMAIFLALEDELEGAALDFLLSQRYSTNVADLWFDEDDHPVWDDRRTEQKETRTTVLRAALGRGLEELTAEQGSRPELFRWGKMHYLHLRHIFGGKKILARTVNLRRVEAGGGLDSVWKCHFDLGHPEHPFRVVAGPVARMVVDTADFDGAGFVLETGISGWPGSPNYADQHKLWKEGKLVPMSLNQDTVRETSKGTLSFVPHSGGPGK
jgi:penicillin amidase